MEKQCKNVCVTDGEHKPLQQILPSKTVKWGGDCKGGGDLQGPQHGQVAVSA